MEGPSHRGGPSFFSPEASPADQSVAFGGTPIRFTCSMSERTGNSGMGIALWLGISRVIGWLIGLVTRCTESGHFRND